MMGFQSLPALVLIAAVLAIVPDKVTASAIDSNGVSSEDLIQYHESVRPIKYSVTTKQSDLAPASKIVGIYFDTVSFNMNEKKLIGKSKNEGNKTKQSQDFETHVKPSTNLPPALDQQVTSVQQVIILHPATSSPATTTTTTTTTATAATTTTTTTVAPTTSTLDPSLQEGQELPAGSRTVRQGSAVSCGEANPNGRSKEHLELDRIIGGKKTVPGEFPFQVRLNIRSRRGSGICGGVLLDDLHILTAAHCMTACASQYLTTVTIENEGVHAVLGDHAIRSNDGEVEVEIEKITPHEKYDACNFYANDHDIALIKTSKPIEYKFTSDGYGSINRPCMPVNNDTVYKESDMVVVSGWGVTRDNSGSLSNILRYVQVPVVNITRCQETYGSRVTNDHVCAGYQSGGKDSCQGDSGGPLVRVVDNRYELVGIVSFGYGCGQPGAPGVYTRVASYIDWIKANL